MDMLDPSVMKRASHEDTSTPKKFTITVYPYKSDENIHVKGVPHAAVAFVAMLP